MPKQKLKIVEKLTAEVGNASHKCHAAALVIRLEKLEILVLDVKVDALLPLGPPEEQREANRNVHRNVADVKQGWYEGEDQEDHNHEENEEDERG